LNAADATTVLFSLDDVLRFVPVAALSDGEHYLIEKYRVAVFTGATLPISSGSEDNWSSSSKPLLALGVTEQHSVTDPTSGATLDFPSLPGVGQEIDAIAKTSANPGGILAGSVLEDGAFNDNSLNSALAAGSPVVHIASHFELGSTDSQSFLLLGDGSILTLDKLFSSGGQIFQGVDLLTLSACQTAEDVQTSDGHQFESLGMIAEQQGASSILASLWPVSDESTPVLMRSFYSTMVSTPNMTKAEALREAQISMISGKTSPNSAAWGGLNRSAVALPTKASSDLPPFIPDPKAPYANPYYWAPFVLIGDWK
jgi:CHAT domain-containing protein